MNSTVLYTIYCYSNFCKIYTYMQLHTFRIICIDYSGLFTLCLNHHAYVDWSILLLWSKEHSMSLHLPVAIYCSMHFRRHGGRSRSGCGLLLSDGWYVGLPCVCVRACADGLWTVCVYAVCAGGSIRLYLLPILHILQYTKAILSIASIMSNNQNVLDDNDHPDDEPNIVQMSSYYDDDTLNNMFKDKGNSFCILSLDCQSINGKLINLILKFNN